MVRVPRACRSRKVDHRSSPRRSGGLGLSVPQGTGGFGGIGLDTTGGGTGQTTGTDLPEPDRRD